MANHFCEPMTVFILSHCVLNVKFPFKDTVQTITKEYLHCVFQCLKQIRTSQLLTDDWCFNMERGENDRDDVNSSSITSFRSLNIPDEISHCLLNLKVMSNWQTQNKSVRCIPHLQAFICKLWKLMTNLGLFLKVIWHKIHNFGQKWSATICKTVLCILSSNIFFISPKLSLSYSVTLLNINVHFKP